jgi:hypothetical protein
VCAVLQRFWVWVSMAAWPTMPGCASVAELRLPSGLEVRDACLSNLWPSRFTGFVVVRCARDRVDSRCRRDRVVCGGERVRGRSAGRPGGAPRSAARCGRTTRRGLLPDGAAEACDVVIDAAGTDESMRQCGAGAFRCTGRDAGQLLGGVAVPADELCRREIELVPAVQYNRVGPARDGYRRRARYESSHR